jgi:[ribosomal protein S18]-alanine N-acetyltransferase
MPQHITPQPVVHLAELVLELMGDADLDEVMAMEQASHAHPWTRGNFLDSISAGHWAYCMRAVDEEPKRIWAYCILLPAVDDLHLLNITVNPIMRQQGIALRLMQAIESIGSNMRIPRILLEVRPSNRPAIRLYEKVGFAHLSTRKAYYPLESASGLREDALVMVKTLEQSANFYEH